jgi:hypothetical protein
VDVRNQKRSESSPDFRCSSTLCQGGKDKNGNTKPWAGWIEGLGSAPRQPPPAAAQAAAPRTAAAQAAPAGRLGFDAALSTAADTIITVGGAFADMAKANGLAANEPTVAAAIVAATASVACSFVIAASDGRLRLGAEPPPPQSARERYAQAIATAKTQGDVALVMMGIGGDAALDGTEKASLADAAKARLGVLALQDQLPSN